MIDPDLKYDLDTAESGELLWASKTSVLNISLPILFAMIFLHGTGSLFLLTFDLSYAALNLLSLVSWAGFILLGALLFFPCFQRHYITRRHLVVRHGLKNYYMDRAGANLSTKVWLGRRVVLAYKRVPPPDSFDSTGTFFERHWNVLIFYGVEDPQAFIRTAQTGEPLFYT